MNQAEVRRIFRYEDGKLFWNIKPSWGVNEGDEITTQDKDGYIVVKYKGKSYKCHRIIFLYHHGYMPENRIDHINHRILDNKIENLREVSHQCNLRNSKQRKDNKSGIKGVGWHKDSNRWQSSVVVNRKTIYLGVYSCFVEAVAHRLAAEQSLNWNMCDNYSPAYIFMKDYVDGKQKTLC